VTTTQRLLRYVTVRDHIRCRAAIAGDRTTITVESVDDPVAGSRLPSAADLHGITLGVESRAPVELRLGDGSPLPGQTVGELDGTTWLSIPWPALRFPETGRG
jgi:hypothetical protein